MGLIRKSVDLNFPQEIVWDTISNSDDLAVWLMPNDFQPVIGHKFTFRTDPAPGFDGIVHCEVLEIDRPNRLKLSWNAGSLESTVEFTLEQISQGTRLTVLHDGFALRQVPTKLILNAGWKRILTQRLPDHLSKKEAH